jgi:translation initiation factor RLI1
MYIYIFTYSFPLDFVFVVPGCSRFAQCIEVEMTSKLAVIAESLCMCVVVSCLSSCLKYVIRPSNAHEQRLRYMCEEMSVRRRAHHQLAQGCALSCHCPSPRSSSSLSISALLHFYLPQNLERDTTNRYGPNSFKLSACLPPFSFLLQP